MIFTKTLMHHGIKGQKWGVQNGPPYPLDAEDHSASEKRAEKDRQTKHTRLSDGQKKALKIGAIAAVSALAIVGGVALAKSGKLDNLIEAGHNIVGGYKKTEQPSEDLFKHFGKEKTPRKIDELLSEVGSDNTNLSDCGPGSIALLENFNNGLKIKAKDIKRQERISIGDVLKLYPTTKNGIAVNLDDVGNESTNSISRFFETHMKNGDNGLLLLKGTGAADNHWITYFMENDNPIFRDQQFKMGNSKKGISMSVKENAVSFNGTTVTGDKAKKIIDWYFSSYSHLPEYIPIKGHQLTQDVSLLDKYFEPK